MTPPTIDPSRPLSELLVEFFEHTGAKQLEACEMLGITMTTLHQYLGGKNPKPAMRDGLIRRLAQAMGAKITDAQRMAMDQLRSKGWDAKHGYQLMAKDDDYCIITPKGHVLMI